MKTIFSLVLAILTGLLPAMAAAKPSEHAGNDVNVTLADLAAKSNPHSPALRSGPKTGSGASREKEYPNSEPFVVTLANHGYEPEKVSVLAGEGRFEKAGNGLTRLVLTSDKNTTIGCAVTWRKAGAN